MLWGIGEYWGMGHFQNNGAAGGVDLRHRHYRYTGPCILCIIEFRRQVENFYKFPLCIRAHAILQVSS